MNGHPLPEVFLFIAAVHVKFLYKNRQGQP